MEHKGGALSGTGRAVAAGHTRPLLLGHFSTHRVVLANGRDQKNQGLYFDYEYVDKAEEKRLPAGSQSQQEEFGWVQQTRQRAAQRSRALDDDAQPTSSPPSKVKGAPRSTNKRAASKVSSTSLGAALAPPPASSSKKPAKQQQQQPQRPQTPGPARVAAVTAATRTPVPPAPLGGPTDSSSVASTAPPPAALPDQSTTAAQRTSERRRLMMQRMQTGDPAPAPAPRPPATVSSIAPPPAPPQPSSVRKAGAPTPQPRLQLTPEQEASLTDEEWQMKHLLDQLMGTTTTSAPATSLQELARMDGEAQGDFQRWLQQLQEQQELEAHDPQQQQAQPDILQHAGEDGEIHVDLDPGPQTSASWTSSQVGTAGAPDPGTAGTPDPVDLSELVQLSEFATFDLGSHDVDDVSKDWKEVSELTALMAEQDVGDEAGEAGVELTEEQVMAGLAKTDPTLYELLNSGLLSPDFDLSDLDLNLDLDLDLGLCLDKPGVTPPRGGGKEEEEEDTELASMMEDWTNDQGEGSDDDEDEEDADEDDPSFDEAAEGWFDVVNEGGMMKDADRERARAGLKGMFNVRSSRRAEDLSPPSGAGAKAARSSVSKEPAAVPALLQRPRLPSKSR